MLEKKSVNLKYCAEVRDQSVTAGGLAEVKKVERVGLRKEVFTVQQACEMLDRLPSPWILMKAMILLLISSHLIHSSAEENEIKGKRNVMRRIHKAEGDEIKIKQSR